MDVKDLLKAAECLKTKNPRISNEIIKIAQNLNDPSTQTNLGVHDPVILNSTVDSSPTVDPNNLNPNVKNYGDVNGNPAAPVVDSHRISFDFNVPPGFSKTELLNHAMEAFNNHPGIKGNKIEVTGYSFKQ